MKRPPFTEEQARQAIGQALCWSDALRKLGYRPVGHNGRTLQRHARQWEIATDHFDPQAVRERSNRARRTPLGEVLVEGSTFSRGQLKVRLFEEGLKDRRCERCGAGELWQGRRMSLVLDHVNGDATDNRLENLQVVCPNCAATLDTHCGRNLPRQRACPRCGESFVPRELRHRYCSISCAASNNQEGRPRMGARRVVRPPHDVLREEIEQLGYCAVGRKYGVSDNAIRKWIRFYEKQSASEGWSGAARTA